MGITLRIKVLLVFAVGLLMLLAVQYVTARTVILDQVAALEEEKGLSVLEQLENLLMDRSQQLASINSDWASWDDTYQFMEDGSPAYLASNYTPSTFSRLKIDGIVVMALDGKPAYVRGMREETGESWEVPPELISWIKEQILPVGSSEEGIKGALKLAGKYYQISVEPILTSDGSGPSRGVMAMVRVMEGKFLGRLSRIGLLPLEVFSLGDLVADGLSEEKRMELLEKGQLVVNFPDHNHGYLLLKDSLGDEAILVKTSMDRKIYEMGQVGVQLLLYSSLIILIALVGFSLFFDRIILRPVSLLNHEIAQVAGVADLDMHVTVPPGNNELTALTTSINGMLQRLSNAMVDLKSSQEKLRLAAAAIENSTDLVAITDSNNKIIMVNHGFCEVSGYTPEEVVGKSPNILQSGIHGFEFYADMWRILLKDGHWHGEITNRRKNGELFPEWLTISVVRNAEGEIENFIAIGTDLTARKEADRRIALLANHDQLTGLPNRILLQDRLTQAILNSRIYHRMAGLLLIGLDRFKHLNDSLGHNYGDELLRQVGERLTSLVARDVTVARMSGDTFAVVLSFHDAQFAARTANDILETLAKPFQIYENEVILTASIGISLFPNDGEVADELMRHGEQAMFRAKSQGRNSFGFYENHMQEDAKERFHLERNLRRAIENNELFLYYQPQYEVSGQHLVGAEALIRWKHPQLGMVSPGKFIPVAEESGLVVPIGNWVLETVCRRLRAWQEEGLQLVTVAVNVSALQFRQAGFVDFVKHCLAINHLHPSLLELEVTESMLIQNVTQTVDILNQLKKLGIRLAIDDFGTGYSSLHYLNRFPLDKLKVDQSFIRGLPTYEDNAAITTAIIQLARNLRLRVIAEGVETQGELEFLQSHQCDEIQGYLFSRPLPVEEFTKKLVSQV